MIDWLNVFRVQRSRLALQGRSQKFAKGGTKQGGWETEVPQRGPGAEPR